jgi:hypothetical protein
VSLLTVLVPKESAPLPAIYEAVRALKTAIRLGDDRIRVERLDGVRVAEFSVEAVQRFRRAQALVLQPYQKAREGEHWESRHLIVPGADLVKGV